MEPNAPAFETAATRSGVSPPPAIGAWMIGCASPKRCIKIVFMLIAAPSVCFRYLSSIAGRHATVDANVHGTLPLAPGGRLAVVNRFAAFQEGLQPP